MKPSIRSAKSAKVDDLIDRRWDSSDLLRMQPMQVTSSSVLSSSGNAEYTWPTSSVNMNVSNATSAPVTTFTGAQVMSMLAARTATNG